MLGLLMGAAAVSGMIGTQEHFRGTLTASSFVIATDAGTTCRADRGFRIINNEASGLLRCDDGRSGDFVVLMGFTGGYGDGTLGKERKEDFTFTVEGWRACPAIQNPLFPDNQCGR